MATSGSGRTWLKKSQLACWVASACQLRWLRVSEIAPGTEKKPRRWRTARRTLRPFVGRAHRATRGARRAAPCAERSRSASASGSLGRGRGMDRGRMARGGDPAFDPGIEVGARVDRESADLAEPRPAAGDGELGEPAGAARRTPSLADISGGVDAAQIERSGLHGASRVDTRDRRAGQARVAANARLRKLPNSLRRGAGCAWREREAKGCVRPLSSSCAKDGVRSRLLRISHFCLPDAYRADFAVAISRQNIRYLIDSKWRARKDSNL